MELFNLIVSVMTVTPSDGPWMVGMKVTLNVLCWILAVLGVIKFALDLRRFAIERREIYSMRKREDLELEEAIKAHNEREQS